MKTLTVMTIDSYNCGQEIFLHRSVNGALRELRKQLVITPKEITELKFSGYLDGLKSDSEGRPTHVALFTNYPIGD